MTSLQSRLLLPGYLLFELLHRVRLVVIRGNLVYHALPGKLIVGIEPQRLGGVGINELLVVLVNRFIQLFIGWLWLVEVVVHLIVYSWSALHLSEIVKGLGHHFPQLRVFYIHIKLTRVAVLSQSLVSRVNHKLLWRVNRQPVGKTNDFLDGRLFFWENVLSILLSGLFKLEVLELLFLLLFFQSGRFLVSRLNLGDHTLGYFLLGVVPNQRLHQGSRQTNVVLIPRCRSYLVSRHSMRSDLLA